MTLIRSDEILQIPTTQWVACALTLALAQGQEGLREDTKEFSTPAMY